MTPSFSPQIPGLLQNDGWQIPQLGLGIYGPADEEAAATVEAALAQGYRLIDTAALYANEWGVGEGIRRSGVSREEVYVTTKLADDRHGYDETSVAFEESLEKLGLEYVDLYLIHWPQPKTDRYVETWKAFEAIAASGRARSIGVSNFQGHHLTRLFEETGVVPAVNQIELHPGLQQADMRAFDAKHGIVTESWSPLGRGRVFGAPVLARIAAKHGKSVAQVVLRWHLDLEIVVIPKSVTPARLRENLDVFDFVLDEHDHALIRALENGVRTGDDPDLYN